MNNIPAYFPYNGETCFVEGSTSLKDYLEGGFADTARDKQASGVLAKLIGKYKNPECGRNRAGFISKQYVIKFPLNDKGEQDNCFEAQFVSNYTARGRSFIMDGFICLIQEKLTVLESPDFTQLPEWVKEIDGGQVGYDKLGNLKAYDFAKN